MKNAQYKVVPFGIKWIIVQNTDEYPQRPIGEKTYSQRTHAYRRCRHLNRAAEDIDEMIKRDGTIIL